MIKQNESSTDRIIRVIIGIFALIAGFSWLSGTPQIIACVVGAVALLTGIVGFCAIYAILGISTKTAKK